MVAAAACAWPISSSMTREGMAASSSEVAKVWRGHQIQLTVWPEDFIISPNPPPVAAPAPGRSPATR
jgi:hypothetical protein